MKRFSSFLIFIILLSLLLGTAFQTPAAALTTEAAPARPQLVVRTYRSNEGPVWFGMDFNLIVRVKNESGTDALGVQAKFESEEVTPRKTGGVIALGHVNGYAISDVSQPMTVTGLTFGKRYVKIVMALSYYDEDGASYYEKFDLILDVLNGGVYNYQTATPTPMVRSQLIITDYKTDVDNLQPGMIFTLDMTIKNVGTSPAKGVTMIVGGGSSSSGSGGTPAPGGVSGGSGEFGNFAPLGTSNIKSLGDFDAAKEGQASQQLIVNVSTDPGAYPVKVTFSYLDVQGNVINDEQVITLLVYNLPKVDINFYAQTGLLTMGMPNILPLQVVNLGRRSAVLGNMQVTSSGGMVENGTLLVGSLESGGYTTLDATIIPDAPGPLSVDVTIDYTDDFGQTRKVTKTLSLEVMDMPVEPTLDPNMPIDPGMNGGGGEESIWQQIWRFILGLFGLDSGAPQSPVEPFPVEPLPEQPLPGGGIRGPKG